jgi:hypothetical protein
MTIPPDELGRPPDHDEDGAFPSPKIRHSRTHLGGGSPRPASFEPDPVPVVEHTGPLTGAKKITAFGKETLHEQEWNRTPNVTGTGAIHVRTFHSKLTDDALVYMDRCINEWLDAHPQYEVKFVTTSIGTLTGKLKEPHLVCQVWV